jgi:hypothetical protein
VARRRRNTFLEYWKNTDFGGLSMILTPSPTNVTCDFSFTFDKR